MDNSGINREKSLVYLRDKIIELFKSNDYVEGSYNDNRFVEYCHKAYMECRDEDVFDVRDLDVLLWADSYQQVSVKIFLYLKEEKGAEQEDADVFCKHEIEYIDWAFSDTSKPAVCAWNFEKYRDFIADDRHDKEINKAHRKWQNNAISNWWLENKDRDAWKIIWVEDKTKKKGDWDIDWGGEKKPSDYVPREFNESL